MNYSPWKLTFICQCPQLGSRWFRGNFTLGIAIDSHPRFFNVILCLLVVEIGIGATREATACEGTR